MSSAGITFVICAAVIAAAIAGMFPLRRAADRSWRLHVAIVRPWVQFQMSIRDQLTPALRRMAAAVAEMQPVLERFGEAVNRGALNHGTCPKCGERKFIGHGPLCSDCYLGSPS